MTTLPIGKSEYTALIAAIPEEKTKVLPPSSAPIAVSSAVQFSFPYRP
ncbi:unannotated protein [freshwater metagenome]|uniref:Unannotated protein n=1 Tax=freshwater metagenome TaxID=449393 RepID=A0A6J7QEZ5_9ZZZZ